MFDFDAAVAAGMGFRVPLTPSRPRAALTASSSSACACASSADDGRKDFEELIAWPCLQPLRLRAPAAGHADQQRRGCALGLVPPRRPGPCLRRRASVRPSSSATADPLEKRDGQVFAEWLGLDPRDPDACARRGRPRRHRCAGDEHGARARHARLHGRHADEPGLRGLGG